MAGGDIFALSKLLGHTSVEMTAKKYAVLHPNFISSVALKPLSSGRGCEATPFGEKKKYCLLKNIIIYWICRNKNRPTVGTTGCEARGDGVRPRNSCSRRLSVKQESPHFSEG